MLTKNSSIEYLFTFTRHQEKKEEDKKLLCRRRKRINKIEEKQQLGLGFLFYLFSLLK
jgi:hypothetical protein